MRIGERDGAGAGEPWSTPEHVERQNEVNRINAPALDVVATGAAKRPQRREPGGSDARPLALHPDALQNPALVRTASLDRPPARERPESRAGRDATPGAPPDACATAHPTPRREGPRRRDATEASTTPADYGCA